MNRKFISFLFLVSGFMCATIIGTLTHEGGHYVMARILGYDAEINFATTFLTNPEKVSKYHSILITIAGPVETILTGTVGLILLLIYKRRRDQKEDLNISQWILIFISLFWLRQMANFFTWLGSYILSGKFSDNPDEVKISRYYDLPDGSILFITALIAITVLFTVIFQFIPKQTRPIFIVAGVIGGISGYILWLKILGPVLMP